MKFSRALFNVVFTLFGIVLGLQIKAVLADTSGDPITAPITSPITVTPTPTSTPTPTPSNGGNSNQNNHSSDNHNDGGSHNNSVCTNAKPASAPTIIAALPSGARQVTLYWVKPNGPADHYMLSFGTKSNQAQYGNTNIGSFDMTKFTVNSLSLNTKYFFKIAAVNGCMPGDFSNEVSVVANGRYVSLPKNTAFAVMGASAVNNDVHSDTKKDKKTQNRIVKSVDNTSHGIFGFIFGLFSHK